MKPIVPLAALACLSALSSPSCKDSNHKTWPLEADAAISDSDPAADVPREVERIHSFIAAALPSYLSAGQPDIEDRSVNKTMRKVVVRVPIVAEEDLYRDTGSGDFVLVERTVSKGGSRPSVVILTGMKTGDRWDWQDEIEVEVAVDPGVLPLSRFPSEAIVKGSPEHLTAVSDLAKREETAASEEVLRKAELRKSILAPLAEILTDGASADGFLGTRKFKIEVTNASPSMGSWTLQSTKYDNSGKKLYTAQSEIGEIRLAYDEEKGECTVDRSGGTIGSLQGTTATANGRTLSFTGGNLRGAVPKFEFK